MMMNTNNNLDERQEYILSKIEGRAFWISFLGLIISIVIKQFIYDLKLINMISELSILIIASSYLLINCMRHNIWDRNLKPKETLIKSVFP